ncbi:MAG: UDP-N-acetylmuramoyl-tripeptide--D-alanyl-D-alanine ligase [Bacteroidales bacterium]
MRTEEIYELFKKSTGVSTDSRNIRQGQLFFALYGPNFNGNKYASDALSAGALCAIIDDPDYETENTILVDDTLKELQFLAGLVRSELTARVIGLTGSNGKTTTRELIAAVLSGKYKTYSTIGNLNNHIGVPLTILASPPDTEILVVEMGASNPGEIGRLCNIARPDIGIVTNIGTAHMEGFGSIEGVKAAKSEMYEYLRKTGGVAFYNESDAVLTELIYKYVVKAVPYADPTGYDLITVTRPEELYLSGSITFEGVDYQFRTNLFGAHNHQNIRAAMAIGLFFGVPVEDVVSAIETYTPSNNRSQVVKTQHNTLVCDSYNANPVSMANAIESFSRLTGPDKVCIIGDMLELGDMAEEEHHKVLGLIGTYGIKKCFAVGAMMKKLAPDYGYEAFADVDELVLSLRLNKLKEKMILIKGSRGIQLEKCYEAL